MSSTNYETVIGLEVHAQLKVKTKLFCACSIEFGRPPNENTCPVCLGQPGTLPVLNRQAVEFAIRAGLATDCRIEKKSVFARKNYFYPDLPKGYQISQYELPICLAGHIDIEADGAVKRIGVTRIHMEEDAGKLVHEHPGTRAHDASWVDFNRGGTPLVEIVSEPDMRSATEAVAYLKKLRSILVYADICDGNLEEGSMRCDANVSIRPVGQEKFGTRVELKNMNSFKNVEKAILYEVERQKALIEDGGKVTQETRLWDADKSESRSMRGKEEAHDYRYFPDPDLLPLILDDAWIARVKASLPELPSQKKERFVSTYQLSGGEAEILTSSRALADYYEACTQALPNQAKKVANWVINEFLRVIEGDETKIAATPLSPARLTDLLKLVEKGSVSANTAKDILKKIHETGEDAQKIIEKEGLGQISDEGALEKTIEEIIAANPKEVARFKAGEEKLVSFFVGQTMKKTGGRANPAKVNEILKKKL